MVGPLVADGELLGGRYRVIEPLGDGTTAKVFRALDENLGKEVALKLLDPQSGEPATWDEAQLLESLTSPYLIPVFNADVLSGSDIRYIASQVMTSGDLEKACKPHGVDAKTAVHWGEQLSYGVERMHAAGLLHRDIKPGNAFLDGDYVRLGDLGMASRMDESGRASAKGTFATVAPEVLADGGMCTRQSDIYSLGVTVFYLLSGHYPSGPVSLPRASRRDRIVASQFDKLRDVAPHVSQSLGHVVDQALSIDPSVRPKTAQDFANLLARAKLHRRSWVRVATHPGHGMCLLSRPFSKGKAITACMVLEGAQGVSIKVRYESGRALAKHEKAGLTMSQALAAMRKVTHDL